MAHTPTDDVSLVPQPADGQAQFGTQVRQAMTAAIAQLDMLEVMPDALIGIEFRRAPRQPFQVQARRSARGEKVLDDLAAVPPAFA